MFKKVLLLYVLSYGVCGVQAMKIEDEIREEEPSTWNLFLNTLKKADKNEKEWYSPQLMNFLLIQIDGPYKATPDKPFKHLKQLLLQFETQKSDKIFIKNLDSAFIKLKDEVYNYTRIQKEYYYDGEDDYKIVCSEWERVANEVLSRVKKFYDSLDLDKIKKQFEYDEKADPEDMKDFQNTEENDFFEE